MDMRIVSRWPAILVALLCLSGPSWGYGVFLPKGEGKEPLSADVQVVLAHDAGRVTAFINVPRIEEADDFVWVIPVPGEVEIRPGLDVLFEDLRTITQPDFRLTNIHGPEGRYRRELWSDLSCAEVVDGFFWLIVDFFPPPNPPSIDFTPLNPSTDSVWHKFDIDGLLGWLEQGEYQLDPARLEILAEYSQAGYRFLLRRYKNDPVMPVELEFAAERIILPLRLMKEAPRPGYNLTVWLLGESRAVPLNWRHIKLNWERVNWLGESMGDFFHDREFHYGNYIWQALPTDRAEAFATGFAGFRRPWPKGVRNFDPEAFRVTTSPAALINELFRQSILETGWPPLPPVPDIHLAAILRRHVPIPPRLAAEVDLSERYSNHQFFLGIGRGDAQTFAETNFYSNIGDFAEYTAEMNYDYDAFADDIERYYAAPLRRMAELTEKYPYITRLQTALIHRPLVDPVFGFNADLPPVAQERRAQVSFACDDAETAWVIVTLEDGRTVRYSPFDYRKLEYPDGTPPALARIEQLSESGPPQVIEEIVTQVVEASAVPTSTQLLANYPNPFNAETVIPFALEKTGAVSFQVYDVLGQPVRRLIKQALPAGAYQVTWDGRDDAGQAVGSGVYLAVLRAGGQKQVGRLMLIK